MFIPAMECFGESCYGCVLAAADAAQDGGDGNPDTYRCCVDKSRAALLAKVALIQTFQPHPFPSFEGEIVLDTYQLSVWPVEVGRLLSR